MRRIYLLLPFILFTLDIAAQGYYWESAAKKRTRQNWSVEIGPGLRMYSGDIQQPGTLFNKPKIAYQGGVRYQFNPRLGLALLGGGRGYQGRIRYAYPGSEANMTGKLWEGQMMVQFSFLKWEDFTKRSFTDRDPVTKANAYIAGGFGASFFSSSYSSNYIPSKDTIGAVYEAASAGGLGMYVPVQFGVRYRFSPSWSIGGELQYHVYITKNVDALAGKKTDAMFMSLVKLGYTFGQKKRVGDMKNKVKKGKGKKGGKGSGGKR